MGVAELALSASLPAVVLRNQVYLVRSLKSELEIALEARLCHISA